MAMLAGCDSMKELPSVESKGTRYVGLEQAAGGARRFWGFPLLSRL
jgi:hypothetical protein